MGSFEDFMIDKTVKDEQRMADLKSEVERLNQDLSKATRDAASLEAKLQREQYTGPTTNHMYAAIELAKERDSLIERLKARDNQINELLKQTAANRVLLERINELEHELKEAQAAAAVMRGALDGCAKHFEEMEDVAWNDDSDVTSETFLEAQKSVQSALSTTEGTAFLERMAEAEWLVDNLVAHNSTDAKRRDAFLSK